MKFLTYNVRTWTRDCSKKKRIFHWKNRYKNIKQLIARENPDVVFLQEANPPFVHRLIPEGYKRATHGFSHIILVKKDTIVKKSRFHIFYDTCQILSITHPYWITIINVHTRWENKIFDNTYQKVIKLLDTNNMAIAGGDWNRWIETLPTFNSSNRLKSSIELVQPEQITFQNYTYPEIKSKLDYFITNFNYFSHKCYTLVDRNSDHYPVIFELTF